MTAKLASTEDLDFQREELEDSPAHRGSGKEQLSRNAILNN